MTKDSRPAECLIVGAPGVGKTLLALSFLESLGKAEALIYHETPEGRLSSRAWSIGEAKRELVGQGPGTTRGLQWATADLPLGLGKGRRAVTIVDSTGLPAEIPAETELRDGCAQTLALLKRAQIVLHLIDLTRGRLSAVDVALLRFGRQLPAGHYIVMGSKADQPAARGVLARLRDALTGFDVLEVCAHRPRDMQAVIRRLRRALNTSVL